MKKMVRRRPRATKIISTTTEVVAATVAASNGNLLEDQYFASPKRKDCKVDNVVDAEIAAILSECTKSGKSNQSIIGDDTVDNCKRHHNVVGKATGVPFTTRSQTKTIENFFKAKTAVISANLKEAEKLKTNSSSKTHSSKSHPQQIIAIHGYNEDTELLAALQDERLPHGDICSEILPEYIFDLSEDTNDTDNTELSDEGATANSVGAVSLAGVHDFMAHRSSIRDSHSSSRSSFATDNIFLQEPVLTLNVDKTPNQASSIKINRSLEIGPIFSSPPSLTASVLNGRFNQIVSLNGSPSKRDSFCIDVKPQIPDNDNSSCDSGVAFISSIDSKDNNNQPTSVITSTTVPQTRRRKPTTPHRIVCPSPVKAAPRSASPNPASKTLSPTTRKMNAAKEQLSPRKSPRHTTSASSKTRRRLNPQPDKPPCSTLSVASVQNEIKQNGHEANNHCIVKHEELETVLKTTNHTSAKSTNGINPKCPTKGHSKSSKPSNCAKTQQQPKIKQQLPLAANNGNRELTEFFPVRRSVRKTKTAVKEEMMRNLEQAVIEERAEGLKIAQFDGKGRGVIADRRFQRGEFVVEYVGDLISMTEASEREKRYALDENAGCYMYYFKHKNQQYCIDATEDTGKLGRLVNHSRNGNLITKVVVVKQRPHLILIAKDDIEPGEEITYDYGDRSKESLLHHPWLAF